MKNYLSLIAALSLVFNLSGCLEESPSSTPSTGGGGGGGGGTTPVCSGAENSSGFQAASYGAFISDAGSSGSLSSATFYFAGGDSIATSTIQVEVYACGFDGSLLDTKTASITSMQTGSLYKAATFSFTTVTLPNCGGSGRLAFKFSKLSGSGAGLNFATQLSSGTSCTVKVSSGLAGTPSQQSTFMATGTYTVTP